MIARFSKAFLIMNQVTRRRVPDTDYIHYHQCHSLPIFETITVNVEFTQQQMQFY